MDTDKAAAGTTDALQSALDAAYEEREALNQRLATIDSLISDLNQAVETVGEPRTTTKRTSRQATAKRAGRKTAAKRGRKRGTRKTTSRKRTARGRQTQGPGRTDRVVEIVEGAEGPLTTADVRSQLSETEPDVSSKLVSAALSYAQQKGRIQRASDGRWTTAA